MSDSIFFFLILIFSVKSDTQNWTQYCSRSLTDANYVYSLTTALYYWIILLSSTGPDSFKIPDYTKLGCCGEEKSGSRGSVVVQKRSLLVYEFKICLLMCVIG